MENEEQALNQESASPGAEEQTLNDTGEASAPNTAKSLVKKLTCAPLVYQRARPRAATSMPSVAMNGGMPEASFRND